MRFKKVALIGVLVVGLAVSTFGLSTDTAKGAEAGSCPENFDLVEVSNAVDPEKAAKADLNGNGLVCEKIVGADKLVYVDDRVRERAGPPRR